METKAALADVHPHNHGHDFGEKLYIHKHSLLHSLPPHLKIVLGLIFIIFGISTPNNSLEIFLGYGLLVFIVLRVAQLPVWTLIKRSIIEVPFLIFAVLMPLAGSGSYSDVLGIRLYHSGIEAGAAIILKGTLGVFVALILSATTKAREIVDGLEKLKLPALMVQIAIFMLRYINVVSDEMDRMKIARESRGFFASGIQHWKVIAQAASALFIRSYERGERVHLAMISRGYQGVFPLAQTESISKRDRWAILMFLTLLAIIKIFEVTYL